MVDPKIMCRKHLLGEHGELHKFLHNWKKRHSIKGRIKNNSIEPLSYKKRHDELVVEMLLRGYNHQSPLKQPNFSYLSLEEQEVKVDKVESFSMLTERCTDCKLRFITINLGGKL